MTAPYALSLEEGSRIFDSPKMLQSAFGPAARATWDSGCGVLVDDPFGGNRGTVLEIKHYKDQYANGQSTIAKPKPSGLVVADVAGGTLSPWEEMYFAYDVAFPMNFDFPISVHMGSMKTLDAVDHDSYPRSNTKSGDSYRAFVGTFQLNGVLKERLPPGGTHSYGIYYYNADKVRRIKYATDKPQLAPEGVTANANYVQFVRGKWHRLELRMKLNTIDNPVNDGIMQAWVDGKLVVDVPNFYWRKAPIMSTKMVSCRFGFWYGGDSQKFAASQDQSIFIDRVTLSRNPITH